MQIDSNLVSLEADIQNANIVKEIVVGQMLKDKIITEEQARTYTEKWQIIVFKRGWFTRWLEIFKKGESSDYAYKFVQFED